MAKVFNDLKNSFKVIPMSWTAFSLSRVKSRYSPAVVTEQSGFGTLTQVNLKKFSDAPHLHTLWTSAIPNQYLSLGTKPVISDFGQPAKWEWWTLSKKFIQKRSNVASSVRMRKRFTAQLGTIKLGWQTSIVLNKLPLLNITTWSFRLVDVTSDFLIMASFWPWEGKTDKCSSSIWKRTKSRKFM